MDSGGERWIEEARKGVRVYFLFETFFVLFVIILKSKRLSKIYTFNWLLAP